MTGAVAPYTLLHGASWLTREGEVLPIPSFHEEWIRQNPELASGARNVCEMVIRTGWVSVALFDGGYLELLVSRRGDPGLGELLMKLLSRNQGVWSRALVMSMDEEGYVTLSPADLGDPGRLKARLATGGT